jgi:glycosyltransferase involved in cell wall biosynthesis
VTGERGPLVTIGISTYNRVGATFPDALESALAQTYPDLEVVVCDNASEDGTEAYMASRRDPRLRYHRHPTNIGANANFNACLDMARGRYFLLLHDDDVLEPDFVARAMAALDGRDTGVLLSGVRVIDGSGRTRSTSREPPPGLDAAGLFLAWFARSTSFYLCSTIFHTQRLRDAGGFDSPHGLFQDVLAIARLAIAHGYVSVPGAGGAFRRHEGNRGTASRALHWAEDSRLLFDTLCGGLPEHAAALRAAGGPYLTRKCYRYVAAVPSPVERWRLYGEVYRMFDRSYAPWRFVARARRRRLRQFLGRARRSMPQRTPHGGA